MNKIEFDEEDMANIHKWMMNRSFVNEIIMMHKGTPIPFTKSEAKTMKKFGVKIVKNQLIKQHADDLKALFKK